MAQYSKEIGLLWAISLYFGLINAAGERGRSMFLSQGTHHSFGSNHNTQSSVGHFPGCESYTEYNDLLQLQNNVECYSIEIVFHLLRVLHERSPEHGPGCVHDVIGKLKTYFHSHHPERCKCTGYVVYHHERYHNDPSSCRNLNQQFDNVYAHLFGYSLRYGPCLTHDLVFIRLGNVPPLLDNQMDCQWEIINHYTTIIDANGQSCSCSNESMSVHTTLHPTDSTPTTMSPTPTLSVSVHYTCMKASTIGTLAHGIKQVNSLAGNCHLETSDHMAPEALVINMCNVSGHSDSWTRGPDVMSVCEKIPLYTPVATFFNGKYSNHGGLAGIFVGCLLDGFKMIVQECDKNITLSHVVIGGHFQLDPVNYSIVM